MKNKEKVTAEECETIWNYSKHYLGDWVEMFTSDKNMMHRYEQFAQRYPQHCKLVDEDQYTMRFLIDPKCMGFKPRAPREGPNLTEDQRQANIERLQRYNKLKD